MDSEITKLFKKLNGASTVLMVLLMFGNIYFFYFDYFHSFGYSSHISNSILYKVSNTGLFNSVFYTRYAIILLAILFIAPNNTKKNEDAEFNTILFHALLSTLIIVTTGFLYSMNIYIYTAAFIISLFYLISSYSKIGSIMNDHPMKDRYNLNNKIFKQMNERIDTELSVNIPFQYVVDYTYDKKNDQYIPVFEKGYINIISPDQATIIIGKPGSGKSYSFNEEFLRQHIMKAFAIINYDYKFPTLTNVCYNYLKVYHQHYIDAYGKLPIFAVINLDAPKYSHRCNPISPKLITKKSEAIDAVYTVFFNIDKKSAQKPDFFMNSAMVITSAALWFLRMYQDGKYLSLPHLIDFIQRPDDQILKILDDYDDLKYFTSAFSDALKKEAYNQLAGQTASARIPLGKLVTDEMFYVMTDPDGDGIDLRINRKEAVTLLNIANNPETQKTNGPALGLYMSQTAKLINKQGRVPCNFHIDELPTVYINGLDNLIATGRSNKICTTLAFQDYTQLVRDYGKEIADSIFNTVGNVICGKVAPETGEKISKMIGKINYKQRSMAESHDNKISMTYSTHKDFLVEASDLAQLSQGDFVGVVADTFKHKINEKVFKGSVSPSKDNLGNEHIPLINPDLTTEDLVQNRILIQNQVSLIIEEELNRIQKKELAENEQKIQEQEQEMEELEGDIDNYIDSSVNPDDF